MPTFRFENAACTDYSFNNTRSTRMGVRAYVKNMRERKDTYTNKCSHKPVPSNTHFPRPEQKDNATHNKNRITNICSNF